MKMHHGTNLNKVLATRSMNKSVTKCDVASTTCKPSNEETSRSKNSTPHFTAIDAPSKPKISPYRRDARKIFVGGLGNKVSNENFREFFEQFGKVIDSVVMIDRETNRHRGFGFVSFEDAADAMKVLASGNGGKPVPPFGFRSGKIKIFGKNCEVKVSEPKKGCGNDGEPLTKGSTLSHPDTNSRTNGELPGYDQFQTKQHDACSIGATCSTGSHDPSSHAGPRSSMANCTVEQSGVNIQQLDHFPYYANGGMPCYYGNEAMYYYNPIQAQAQGIYHPYFYPAHDSTTGVAPMPPQYYAPPPVYAHPYPIPPATHTGTHEYMNAQYFDGQTVREKDF